MKKFFSALLALISVVCLFTGCEEKPDIIETDGIYTEPYSVTEELSGLSDSVIQKVALITDGDSIDDKGYNQACWEGIVAWCTSKNIPYTYYQPTEGYHDAYVVSIDQAVSEGANVIVMGGSLFSTALIEQQERYPEVYFIGPDIGYVDMTYDYVTFYEPTANTVCITFAEEQAGYLAGYAAVKEGYTQLGFLGKLAIPSVIRYGYGFVQGADAAASEMEVNIQIKYTYGGICYCSGEDLYLAKLESWVESGTETICLYGDNYNAPGYAKKLDAKIIVGDIDMSSTDPDILTSGKKELQNSIEFILSGLYGGRWDKEFGGKVINLSLQDGNFVGLPTTDEAFRFQTFTLEEYEDLITDIRTGNRIVSDFVENMPTVSPYTEIVEIG